MTAGRISVKTVPWQLLRDAHTFSTTDATARWQSDACNFGPVA